MEHIRLEQIRMKRIYVQNYMIYVQNYMIIDKISTLDLEPFEQSRLQYRTERQLPLDSIEAVRLEN